MSDTLSIPPVSSPVRGAVRPPGSKSITNRALVCSGLAHGESLLTGVLDSEDTRVMVAGLAALGIPIEADWAVSELRVQGSGGRIPAATAMLDCRASGTTMRFLSAVCGLGHGSYRLDGTARMRKRPIDDLLGAMRSLGVDAEAESEGGCPPVVIRSQGMQGGRVTVAGGTSSQFASGLAMVAPCATDGMEIEFAGELVSLPYLAMTRNVMESFGGCCLVSMSGPGGSPRAATRDDVTRSSPTPRPRVTSPPPLPSRAEPFGSKGWAAAACRATSASATPWGRWAAP